MTEYPSKIEFVVPFEYEGEIVKGSLDFYKFERNITELCNPDEIVAPADIVIRIDYPLSKPKKFKLSQDAPITRIQLARGIYATYVKIYQEERASSTVQTLKSFNTFGMQEGEVPGMLNRNRTNGKYGIWGHTLEQLALVYATRGDNGVYSLAIDS